MLLNIKWPIHIVASLIYDYITDTQRNRLSVFMAMVLSISVLNGFESRVVKKIMGFEGDIRVSNLSNWDKSVADIKSMDDVQIAIEFQERKGLILGRGDSQRMVLLKAVDPDYGKTLWKYSTPSGIFGTDNGWAHGGNKNLTLINI